MLQIRCGDLYAGEVVEEFNKCAITKHNCVAARVDVNKYPEPPPEALVNSFDINQFTVSFFLGVQLPCSVSQTALAHIAKQQIPTKKVKRPIYEWRKLQGIG